MHSGVMDKAVADFVGRGGLLRWTPFIQTADTHLCKKNKTKKHCRYRRPYHAAIFEQLSASFRPRSSVLLFNYLTMWTRVCVCVARS